MGKLNLVDRSTSKSLKETLGPNSQIREGREEKPGYRDKSWEPGRSVNAGYSQSGGD